MKKLSPKQKLFCKEYLIDLNATQAAIRAGYSKKTAYSQGWDLLKKPEIQKEIKKYTEKRCEKIDITVESVLADIKKIGDMCMQAEEVFDREGNPTGEYVFKEMGALKSRELLGRYLKMFTDKVEVDAQVTIISNIPRPPTTSQKISNLEDIEADEDDRDL